jgi:hypothetical protein
MAPITETAKAFFDACETGRGWEACQAYCSPDATFAAQAEPLADVKTLEQYTDWMKGLMTVLTDATYEVKSFATDKERNSVCAYAVFSGTHLAGGPVPPTGKSTSSDYVYGLRRRRRRQVAHGRGLHPYPERAALSLAGRRSEWRRARHSCSGPSRCPGGEALLQTAAAGPAL